MASTRASRVPSICTVSPTRSAPLSTRPVATVPRLRIANTSSTVIRNMSGSVSELARDEALVAHQEVRKEPLVRDVRRRVVRGIAAAVHVGHGGLVHEPVEQL